MPSKRIQKLFPKLPKTVKEAEARGSRLLAVVTADREIDDSIRPATDLRGYLVACLQSVPDGEATLEDALAWLGENEPIPATNATALFVPPALTLDGRNKVSLAVRGILYAKLTLLVGQYGLDQQIGDLV